jgi:DNA-3-methyladenine glycosylase
MHHCANVVTGADGDGQAVLLRAVLPLEGLDVMAARRHGRRRLADGPGKLCQAFGLHLGDSGVDVCTGTTVQIVDDGTPPPHPVVTTPRIGITKAVDRPWRFLVPA